MIWSTTLCTRSPSSPSAITRISGSVPDFRTRMRPLLPSLATAEATNPATLPDGTVTTPLPVDSYGLVAASVGAGGGFGGSATAKAYTIDVPVPTTPYSAAISACLSRVRAT